MDFINFKVGPKTIALKILDILLTERYEKNLTELPNNNKSFIGVKDYMGSPTPIFDLGMILNNQSTQKTNAELAKLLQGFEQELSEWMRSLEISLNDQVPFTKTRDPRQTEFWNWFSHYKTDNEDLAAILNRFEEPHMRVYEMADKVLSLAKSNQVSEALTLLAKEKRTTVLMLLRLFESAREQILLDYKPIIIFTTIDGRSPHLGLLVDKVEDSVSVNEEDIKPLSKLTSLGFDIDPQTRKMMTGLIKMEEHHSVIIDSSAIFIPEELTEDAEVEA